MSDTVDQLQRREHQFTAVLIGWQRLVVIDVAFATTVGQISAALLQALHGEWRMVGGRNSGLERGILKRARDVGELAQAVDARRLA